MADKVAMRKRLMALQEEKIVHRIVSDHINLGLVYLQDYTDANFARFIAPHADLLTIPKTDGSMPIGLTQFDIPYEDINAIEIFGIEKPLYEVLRHNNPKVLERYNAGNIIQGIDYYELKDLAGLADKPKKDGSSGGSGSGGSGTNPGGTIPGGPSGPQPG
jgi:hypothetical protein